VCGRDPVADSTSCTRPGLGSHSPAKRSQDQVSENAIYDLFFVTRCEQKLLSELFELFPEPVCVNVYGAQEPISPAYVAWRPAVTTNRVVVPARQAGNRFLGSFKGLHIRALVIGFLEYATGL
jgi:hypothetical protein